ncbi:MULTISPECIES: hypothetical protein [Paenibacillus]|uniref:Uncharacterized protein n=1 Tax=Paenibacillus vini TaxID=1476024 RepID=A0ABQ4ME87_9BACL|nr:hypothetical protein [Paenibacillus vini]MDN4069717.1 hypothetical protein [Paenibacillus vini]GIP54277.1 hypothetical protein J42TS3_33120 [Paenibacillus vini]
MSMVSLKSLNIHGKDISFENASLSWYVSNGFKSFDLDVAVSESSFNDIHGSNVQFEAWGIDDSLYTGEILLTHENFGQTIGRASFVGSGPLRKDNNII